MHNLDDRVYNAGIRQLNGTISGCNFILTVPGTYGGCIAELVFLASKNLSQDTTHDLPTSGLGQIRNDEDGLGGRKGTNTLSDLENEILSQLVVDLIAIFDGDEGVDGLSGKFISDTNHSSFCNGVMLDQCSFNFGSGKTMPRDVDDVINTTSDPVVAFVVTSSSVARELGKVSGWLRSTNQVVDSHSIPCRHSSKCPYISCVRPRLCGPC